MSAANPPPRRKQADPRIPVIVLHLIFKGETRRGQSTPWARPTSWRQMNSSRSVHPRARLPRSSSVVILSKAFVVPLLPLLGLLAGCATSGRPPIPTVSSVELPRFMGDWYVIAHIPTFIEKHAYHAVESYALDPDSTIATTFTFRDGGPDGPAKRYTPRGFVRNRDTNATWGMQFIWPIRAEYL